MLTEIEYSFKLMGEWVTVHTNSLGSTLYVTFGRTLIEDSSGYCIKWPYLGHLSGAALKAAENKILKEAGVAAIRGFIHFAAEELSEAA